jgi:hypothetical protein
MKRLNSSLKPAVGLPYGQVFCLFRDVSYVNVRALSTIFFPEPFCDILSEKSRRSTKRSGVYTKET